MEKADVAGLLLFDQINTRYATDATNMQVWSSHYVPNALLADERSIEVVVDRMLGGYSVMVRCQRGELTRVLAETTVATFLEAEKIACADAAENNFFWHKVTVICR
jgi:hypothetical protein